MGLLALAGIVLALLFGLGIINASLSNSKVGAATIAPIIDANSKI